MRGIRDIFFLPPMSVITSVVDYRTKGAYS
jgi:hypothetical protein